LLARVRRAGPRGLSLALAARFDPSGLRRARLRWASAPAPARAILVSSYVNPTRAAFEALSVFGTRPALHLRSGPGALGGIPVPAGVRSVPLAAAIALDRRGARKAVAQACDAVRDRLRGLSTRDPHDPWGEDDATRFRRALVPTLVPEVAAAIVGLDAVVAATRAETVIVGDEFSFVDRAALHLGKVRGIPTASRQHGVLDSHYLRDSILADVHLAWDEATVAWLEVHGAIPPGQTVRVAGRGAAEPGPPAGRGNDVVLFLQPLELVGVPMADWLSETLPPLLRAARSSGGRLRAKLHPLQSRSALAALLPADFAGQVDLVTDISAREILQTARAAVTLDSSVAVDCRDFGVPCFSTAWYEGTYAQDLARLGWVVPCATPERLEASVRDVFRRGNVP
jgi:hypothetical protein